MDRCTDRRDMTKAVERSVKPQTNKPKSTVVTSDRGQNLIIEPCPQCPESSTASSSSETISLPSTTSPTDLSVTASASLKPASSTTALQSFTTSTLGGCGECKGLVVHSSETSKSRFDQIDQHSNHVLSMKQIYEVQPFWRGFEDKPVEPSCSIYTGTSLDKEIGIESVNMALTSRKPCKLDAICAKLKSKGPTSAVETIGLDSDKQATDADAPTDLSTKCVNNNIIGKLDLHIIDVVENINDGPDKTADTNKLAKNIEVNFVKHSNLLKDSEISKENFNSSSSKQLGFSDAVGSSRRKSRKAAQPRNIAQVRDSYENIDEKDELAEYEINNQNTNFPPEDTYDAEVIKEVNSTNNRNSVTNSPADNDVEDENSNHSSALNLSKSSSLNNSTNSKKSTISSSADEVFDGSAPLDLSVSNKSNEFGDNEDSSDNEDFYRDDQSLVIDEEADKGHISGSSSPSGNPHRDSGGDQAAHLKDYAESTMNELISMYGFGGSNPHDLTKHVPVNNFKEIFHSQMRALSALKADIPAIPTKKPKLSVDFDSESDDGSEHANSVLSHFDKSLGAGSQSKQEGSVKLQNDRFTSSSSFINAVFNASSNQGSEQLLTAKTLLPNYSKYLKRYNNGGECGGKHCNDFNYKEHYHCIDCSFQVFIKKEEMVRHYKWHKKREESLQHGFLRFSPLDNCSKRFGPCTHNRKQTHYHCLQKGCDKVYISTSDVQMHANYHRKDSAIMSEGFQRFRATEDCGTLACSFYGQRTTHFHCLRPDCRFTFKNKADMEKHKSYHQKDEVLGRDGFKKFMKYEHCNFQSCRYSKLSNHIHCIRSGCDYVLHSTAQLYSHKRKHERRDFEAAYKHFRTSAPPSSQGPAPITQQNDKNILPRNDFGSVGPATQSASMKPMIQSVPTSVIQTMAGLKRPSGSDLVEPFELKKPKLEPKSEVNSDIDMSGPPSPSTGRSSPWEGSIDKGLTNEHLNDVESDFSDHHDDGKFEHSSYDEDSLDLSGSLSLKIPLLQRSDLGTSHIDDSKPPNLSMHLPANNPTHLPSAFSPSTMPGTLPGTLVSMMNQGTLMTVPSTLTGISTLLQPPKSIYNERREKDDSWKTYLVRYTANDPCNPRCQYLYKDHYHCKIDGCLVLFKSKDGVREHARFHELQDRITPIAYKEYAENEACPGDCQYSEKERHYHCIWTGCTHVVPYVGPTFGRLEHYRIHEYARVASGRAYSKSGRNVTNLDDSHIRRRGRPPKYPKIELPKIPKVELTDEEIRQSHTPTKNAECSIASDQKVVNGFRIFNAADPCPDERCNYIGRQHYHCARPRCFTITDRIDVLNLHAKDFHSFVKILEGYEFFDRNVSCRRMHCTNNETNRHFHCTRPKCDYSFIRHSTMVQHEKKHSMSENGTVNEILEKPLSPVAYRRDIPIRPASNAPVSQSVSSSHVQAVNSMIKTESGMYIPIPSVNHTILPNIPLLISPTQGSLIIPQSAAGIQHSTLPGSSGITAVPLAIPISTIQALPPSVTTSHMMTGLPHPLITAGNVDGAAHCQTSNSSAPLTVLLQRGINQIPQPSWNEIKAKMHYGLSQNCGRPFCKLKKKDHFHCYDCNQAFSDPARLRSHIGKHGIKFKRNESTTQPLALGAANADEKPPVLDAGDDIKNGDMDPDEAKCLADNGNITDSDSEEDKNSSSLNLNPSTFSEMIFKAQEQNKLSDFPESSLDADGDNAIDYSQNSGPQEMDDNSLEAADLSSRSGRKITKTKHEGFMNSGEINFNKQRPIGSPKSAVVGLKPPYKLAESNHNHLLNVSGPPTRGMKDDTVPEGYSRWKYNEECNYPKCAYRHSVTHFHCNRLDCGYGFSDRSRLVQHTLRHERIDSITGGELQQYRINQDCEQASCEFNKKMSHFHCKRCIYNCTDSSKVLTHRKYHAKLDSIANQGFRKFSGSEECGVGGCGYVKKQTHFHCLVQTCQAAVLGLPQMNSHKLKHVGDIH